MEWDLAGGDGRIAMLDRDNLRYVELDDRGNIVRPLAPLGFDRSARTMGIALLPGGRRLIGISHPNAARIDDRFPLYLLRPSGAGFEKRLVTEVTPPEGAYGFSVAGIHQDKVVLLTTPAAAMVFVPHAIFV